MRLNEEVIGWTVVEYQPEADDGPTLILKKGESMMPLVRDRPAQSQDWVCFLISLLDGQRFNNLTQDSELQVKGYTYNVVDIKGHQVVIKDANSGQDITAPRITPQEVRDLKAFLSGRQTGRDAGMGGAEYQGRSPLPRVRR